MLESSFMYWVNQFPWSPNPNRAVTAIGAIGRLKLSDQIRVRVTPSPAAQITAVYCRRRVTIHFKLGTWSAADATFEAIDKLGGREEWLVAPDWRDDPQTDDRDHACNIDASSCSCLRRAERAAL